MANYKKNPYIKHIPVKETTWAKLRDLKRVAKLHSLNEVIEALLQWKGTK